MTSLTISKASLVGATKAQKARFICLGLGLLLILLSLFSISTGAVSVTWQQILKLVPAPAHIEMIIYDLRLPRSLMCLLVGATLSLCGAVMQGLFRNPLAEPGIIGVSSGAGLGAGLAIVIFTPLISHDASPWLQALLSIGIVPLFAFIFGVLTTLMVYKIGTSAQGTSVTTMLLAGVAIGAISGAVLGFLNYVADDMALRDFSLWSMGSMAGARWPSILLSLVCLIGIGVCFVRQAKALNAFLLGEPIARHLGVNVQKLKQNLIILCALGVGVSVAVVGPIGFIGLVVPHLGRLLVGPKHEYLLPVSALLGAAILLLADILARTLLLPQELPVGIVTAALGAPFFIYLLLKQKRGMQ